MSQQDSLKILINLVDITTGIHFQIKVPSNFTVQDIKRQIQYQSCISVPEQYLTFNDKPLKNGEKINKLGITNGAVINIEKVEYKGGGGQTSGKQGSKFCNLANRKQFGVVSCYQESPMTVQPGLMLQIKCSNRDCKKGFGKKVLIRKGFGDFNIIQQMYECVCHLCGKAPQQPAFNMGFYKANAQIKGRNTNTNQIVKMSIKSDKGKYETFQYEGKQQDIYQWNYLKANVEPLK